MTGAVDPQERARQMISEGIINPDRSLAATKPPRAQQLPPPAEPPPESTSDQAENADKATAQAPGAVAAPPRARRRQPRGERLTATPKRQPSRHPTTANIPEELLRSVRRELAGRRIDGSRLTLVDVVNDELDRLPTLGQALLAELDSYAGQLNVGVPTTDPSYRMIARLAVRLTDNARRQLDQSVYTLEYDHDTPVERQDLIALALARWLSAQ